MTSPSIPIVDLRPFRTGSGRERRIAARAIGDACRESGFFYVVEHGVSPALENDLEAASRRFFAQDLAAKLEIRMERGGRAWRGYFPVGGELTSGKPDWKEGVYFGAELGPDHPLVRAGTPLHGPNLFPSGVPEMRGLVLEYLSALTEVGHRVMAGISLSLGLPESYFAERYTANPLILFRIFNYPAAASAPPDSLGVGEHTDYGLLTLLRQDRSGGLEIKARPGWIPAPPVPGSYVCNIGDMLDRMTGGRYRSTPHRVRNPAPGDRLSFPFFFDPNFHAEVHPIEAPVEDDRDRRWDRASVHAFQGTYGEYLLRKVSRVFPELGGEVL